MTSVTDFLKRSSDKIGFFRERFEDRKAPTDFNNITIFPFFGDIRSLTVLSSLVLKRYREQIKGSKYFILASWPGFQSLFPYVDEYWGFNDEPHLKSFYEQSEGMRNKSDLQTIFVRNTNEFFRDVLTFRDLSIYYNQGLTNGFFKTFEDTKKFLPFVPSSAFLGKDFNRDLVNKAGYKIFIHPSLFCKQWKNGKSVNINAKREFWTELVDKLLSNGYMPIIWQNYMSFDISQDFAGRCIFIKENDISKVMSVMRSSNCVLDVFNNISRFAILSRSPYLCIDERSRYFNLKEHEFDDLCGKDVPKEYIYTFSTIISDGIARNWHQDIFLSILTKLEKFLPEIDRDLLPSTGEVYFDVPYQETVRKIKRNKVANKFIRVNEG